jgi:hypothetical protein
MRYAKETLEKIQRYEGLGYEIVENTNRNYPNAQCRRNLEIVKLAHTNHRVHGWPKRIIWAQRERLNAPVDRARQIILDCDNPSAAAAIYYNQHECDVDDVGDVWLGDRNCWADADQLIAFADWLEQSKAHGTTHPCQLCGTMIECKAYEAINAHCGCKS